MLRFKQYSDLAQLRFNFSGAQSSYYGIQDWSRLHTCRISRQPEPCRSPTLVWFGVGSNKHQQADQLLLITLLVFHGPSPCLD